MYKLENDLYLYKSVKVGTGGNSVLYNCKYKGKKYVIKFFKCHIESIVDKRYKRFLNEIEMIKYINDNNIIKTPKIIYSNNKAPLTKFDYCNSPFYVIESASKISYKNKSVKEKLNDILGLALIIQNLHKGNICHRDIKLDNIMEYNSNITLIDYGTAVLNEEDTIDDTENVGSRDTEAPEMANQARYISGYSFRYADIYSFGKTIWMILSGNKNGRIFTTYNRENINCKLKVSNLNIGTIYLLEYIITYCTQEIWNKRINMERIVKYLSFAQKYMVNDEKISNQIKYSCIFNNIIDSNYDEYTINDENKIRDYISTNISSISGLIELNVCGTSITTKNQVDFLNIEFAGENIYKFDYNNYLFVFKPKSIIIKNNRIIIQNVVKNLEILTPNTKLISSIDSFSLLSIFTSKIDETTERFLVDADIVFELKQIDELINDFLSTK